MQSIKSSARVGGNKKHSSGVESISTRHH